jgi:hypothetical protein
MSDPLHRISVDSYMSQMSLAGPLEIIEIRVVVIFERDLCYFPDGNRKRELSYETAFTNDIPTRGSLL